jgi:UDP-glucose 4-epimerase
VKHILVTGGAGFIGSHLTEALLARGDTVTVVDDLSTGTLDNLAAVQNHPRLTWIEGDAGDAELVSRVAAHADCVYHLAAAVGVALVARQPKETIERNIHPTELLLDVLVERCRSGQQVKFFLASTSEVYGKNPKAAFHEEDDLIFGSTTRARWSYGASKAIDEFLALACHRQYGLPVVIGRFFNVVGPRQSGAYGMVLPRFVDAALAGRPLTVHDDGRQTRCFAHVQDVIVAVTQLMDAPAAEGRVFNIGSDQPISIQDLAHRVIAATGSAAAVEYQTYADAYDADFEDIRRRVPDLTRLHATIPHRNRYDLDAIIQAVIDAKTRET